MKSRFFRQDIPVYRLRDWEGEDVDGTFYQSELQGVSVDENTAFKIETVLKKKNGRRTETSAGTLAPLAYKVRLVDTRKRSQRLPVTAYKSRSRPIYLTK